MAAGGPTAEASTMTKFPDPGEAKPSRVRSPKEIGEENATGAPAPIPADTERDQRPKELRKDFLAPARKKYSSQKEYVPEEAVSTFKDKEEMRAVTQLVTDVREAAPRAPATAVTTREKIKVAAAREPVSEEPEEPEDKVAELTKPGGTAEAGTGITTGEEVASEEVVVTEGSLDGDKAANMPLV